jgi:hypothetical protein
MFAVGGCWRVGLAAVEDEPQAEIAIRVAAAVVARRSQDAGGLPVSLISPSLAG